MTTRTSPEEPSLARPGLQPQPGPRAQQQPPPPLRRLAILTSGGDAPGMNAAIRAATLLALARGIEVLGVHQGYRGLIAGDLRPLLPDDVHGGLRDGGTLLGTARCPEFHDRDARDRARAVLAARQVDGLLAIGGNGTLAGLRALIDPAEAGVGAVRAVGLPASIDNDVGLTGLAIGVDTALNTIVEACDRITDTATAHHRTFIIEVMGRDCGYLAMTAAVAAGADAVFFREAGRTEAEVVEAIVSVVLKAKARSERQRRVLVIKAEGVGTPSDRLKRLVDARLLGLGVEGALIETRVTVLGHIVRGGRPSAFDRLLASRLARVGVRALEAGLTGVMAAWMPPGALPVEVCSRAPTDPYCFLVDLDAVHAESARLADGTSELVRWRVRALEEIEDVLAL